MLSRVANNLYWMGRYLERAEHMARYSNEIYFSSLDAPIMESYNRNFVLESMLYMAGIFDMEAIKERDVLYKIGVDPENPNSMLSIITLARENARGVRNAISSDLWEAINRFYHRINDYSVEAFVSTGLYHFTQTIIEQNTIVRGKINGTLLHDETWAIILMGMHLERAIQIIRIINSKLNDIKKVEEAGYSVNDLSFEWATLLQCTESFDMNKKYYGAIPHREQVLEFLVLVEECPRSINHSLQQVRHYLSLISNTDYRDPNTVDYSVGKLCAHYEFLTIDDIKEDIHFFLNETRQYINKISREFEKKYLSF